MLKNDLNKGRSQNYSESRGNGNWSSESKASVQDNPLSDGEIRMLKKWGINIHDLKPNSKFDLFKDKDWNIYYKRKTGRWTSEPEYTNFNINDF